MGLSNNLHNSFSMNELRGRGGRLGVSRWCSTTYTS